MRSKTKTDPGFILVPKILIVDDDSVFRAEFRECFEDYEILEASNGLDALGILKKANDVGLMFLDVRMAGMDGIEVLNRIRKDNPQLRIVMLTGFSSTDVVVEALRGQADDFIEKPIDIEATRKVIEKFFGRMRGEASLDSLGMKDKVERVKSFIHRNILKKVTLKDAASSVCMSPKYLSRVFQEQTGKGFNDYKLAAKIEQAKKLLTSTGYTVEQISYRLGYQNTESFSRQFKKITKKTPVAFRTGKKK